MTEGEERPGSAEGETDLARTLARVDHIILASPDVDDTADRLTTTLGVRAVAGGRHPAWGTRNALIALGDQIYLEIVGPDPDSPPQEPPRPFGLETLSAPRLATWAVKGRALEALVTHARAEGVELGEVQRRTRRRPDGLLLSWAMTDLTAPRADGIIPFFVDWGETPHPATTSPQGGTLIGLSARHPEAGSVHAMLRSLGVAIEVEPGETPELIATLRTHKGEIELR
jgi:catechol 2,3-dioxygenase-like lactoylglutathione lyase family enzyme